MKNSITLDDSSFGFYLILHDDGRDLIIESDAYYCGLAMTFGWSPCAKCRRSCKGASDGTISCDRRTAEKHIATAQEYLDAHIGKRVADPGYFKLISYPCNPDLIRALYTLAYEHHSGQWSRGYRLLCRVKRYAKRHQIDIDSETRTSRRLYMKIAARYGDKL